MPSAGRTSHLPGWARSVGASLLDAVYPGRCALCRCLAGTAEEPLCPTCQAAVEAASRSPACPRCGATLTPFAGAGPACASCARQHFAFDSVGRVGAYTGGLRALLTVFKFGGREELDLYFSRRLARVIMRLGIYEDIDALVAVPTCWQHRLRRAFHPAVVLGRLAARQCGIPYAPLLARSGGGPHQVGLSFTARQVNVRGRFRLVRGCSVAGARLLLVDDVMTTGATAGECARVLKRAGAAEVHVAVVARAGDDPVTLRHV